VRFKIAEARPWTSWVLIRRKREDVLAYEQKETIRAKRGKRESGKTGQAWALKRKERKTCVEEGKCGVPSNSAQKRGDKRDIFRGEEGGGGVQESLFGDSIGRKKGAHHVFKKMAFGDGRKNPSRCGGKR